MYHVYHVCSMEHMVHTHGTHGTYSQFPLVTHNILGRFIRGTPWCKGYDTDFYASFLDGFNLIYHMGQVPQDGNFGPNVAFFLKKKK